MNNKHWILRVFELALGLLPLVLLVSMYFYILKQKAVDGDAAKIAMYCGPVLFGCAIWLAKREMKERPTILKAGLWAGAFISILGMFFQLLAIPAAILNLILALILGVCAIYCAIWPNEPLISNLA